MLYGPDYDSDEGLSDDNDYFDFQERVKQQRNSNLAYPVAELNEKQKQCQTVVSAILHNKLDIVIEELNKGLLINELLENNWTPLLLSASVCNLSITLELINRGADVNSTRNGSTVLMVACNGCTPETSADCLNIVKELVKRGSNVKAKDNKRKTVLMYAAYSTNLEIVKYLLPLSVANAKDNQRWTALFYAVEGNQPEIVEYLLKEGFSYDIKDIRDCTPIDIAEQYEFEDILSLFPKTDSDNILCIISDNQVLNFEDTFKKLKNNEKPRFLTDIYKILYGTRCESLAPILEESQINLLEFLSASDDDLKEIGIALPYQRNRILSGIYKLHKHPFNPQSLKVVPITDTYSNIDVGSTVLSSIKQITAMEASLRFVMKYYQSEDISDSEREQIANSIKGIRNHLIKLKLVGSKLMERAEMWDSKVKPADLIVKKTRKIPWIKIVVSISIVSMICYKYLKPK